MLPMFKSDRGRRDFLRMTAAGAVSLPTAGWFNVLASHAAAAPPKSGKAKACILLYMDGGPSHKETFDLKPDSSSPGEFKPINTSVSGIQISEHLPKIAQSMSDMTLLRGMSTAEGAHALAKFKLHTGYREGQGGVAYPSIGAIVSSEKGRTDFPAPNYVSIGGRVFGSGYLGPKHQPLQVPDPAKGVEDLRTSMGTNRFDSRVGLLHEMERAFFGNYQTDLATDHRVNYERAVRLMQSKESKAFDLSLEDAKVRSAYGASKFGDGCLMARRLIEVGVPFVEVSLGGWDTHQEIFDRVKSLSAQIDPAVSTLIRDLKERGLFESTLIVWMGDFGRTPKINTRGAKPGRDHYPRAWTTFMAGGGAPKGKLIGRTDKEGAAVEEGKVSATEYLATICSLMGIDHTKENDTPIGRPIRLVEKGTIPVKEIVG